MSSKVERQSQEFAPPAPRPSRARPFTSLSWAFKDALGALTGRDGATACRHDGDGHALGSAGWRLAPFLSQERPAGQLRRGRISNGEGLKLICLAPGMPTRVTVLNWIRTFPDFYTRHGHAREAQAHYLVDETIDIARAATTPEQIAKARLMFDVTKWAASKLAPKVYGDKLEDPALHVPQQQTDMPSDIVIARQLMYLVHKALQQQAKNGSKPANGAAAATS